MKRKKKTSYPTEFGADPAGADAADGYLDPDKHIILCLIGAAAFFVLAGVYALRALLTAGRVGWTSDQRRLQDAALARESAQREPDGPAQSTRARRRKRDE